MKGEGLEKARLKHDKPATPEKREELKEQSKPFKLKEPHVIIGGTHQTNQFDKLRNGIAIFSVLAMVCGVGTHRCPKKPQDCFFGSADPEIACSEGSPTWELSRENDWNHCLTGAKRREWIGLGVAGMIITSDEMDHSRTFPA